MNCEMKECKLIKQQRREDSPGLAEAVREARKSLLPALDAHIKNHVPEDILIR